MNKQYPEGNVVENIAISIVYKTVWVNSCAKNEQLKVVHKEDHTSQRS